MPETWQEAGFGLYVHWPYCQAKCPYCDFNSHVVQQIDQAAWARAYISEIKRVGAETEGRLLRSVFFGGGTPSLMDADLVAAVLDTVRDTWTLANDCEITLEANPTSVEAGRFAGYRDAGVNRVSLGVQALNDTDLRALGRLHSAKEAQAAFDVARGVFDRVSFDLIYARQGQTLADWDAELSRALDMSIDHLSLYQLTIEEGTAFGDRYAAGKLRDLPDDDVAADMFEITQERCAAAGMPAYEVSNHAAAGAESRHNLIYWQSGDYAGIGPGAHGRLTLNGTRFATTTPLGPAAWLAQVNRTGSGEAEREALSQGDIATETVLMGFRLAAGLPQWRTAMLPDHFISNINMLVESDHMEVVDDHVRVTARYRPVLNAVLREILRD